VRKLSLILIALTFLLCSCTRSAPASPDSDSRQVQEINIKCTYEAFDMAVGPDGRIYIPDKDRIIVLDGKGKEVSSIKVPVSFCTGIAAGDGILYAWDDSSRSLKALDMNGRLIKEYPIQTGFVIKMCYVDGNIFILTSYPEDGGKISITAFDIESGKTEKLEFAGLKAFSVYKDKTLLLGLETHMGYDMVVYDWDKKQKVTQYSMDISCNDFYYDSRGDVVYSIMGDTVKSLYMEENKTETMYTGNAGFYRISIYENNCLVLDRRNKVIYTVNRIDSLNAKGDVITVSSPYSDLDLQSKLRMALDILKSNNPKVQIKYETIGHSQYLTNLKTRLMAGDSGLDIFELEGMLMDDFVRNDVMLDLNTYPLIKDKFADMFEGVASNCSYEGRLIGAPLMMSLESWGVNEKLLEKLGLVCPAGSWTMDDFYRLAKKARQDINGDGKPDTYIAEFRRNWPPFFNQYLSTHIDLIKGKASINTDEFTGMLKLWKRMWDEDLLLGSLIVAEPKDNVVFYRKDINLLRGNELIVSLPSITIDGKPVYTSQIYLLCINKNSKDKEICAKFIEALLSKDVQTSSPSDAFYKDRTLYKSPEDVLVGVLSDEKNFNTYEFIMNNSRRYPFNKDINIFTGNTIANYLVGDITVEEAARKIDEKIRMVVGE